MEEVQDYYKNYNETPKLFKKWDYDECEMEDITLQNYIALTGKAKVFLPHTAGRYQTRKFKKATMPIVERVLGSLMFHGRNGGKKMKAMRIMQQCLEIIHLQSGENPVQVLLRAIANCGPREDSTRIGKGGNVKRQAVDVSSLRRINQAIYFITKYARDKAFKNRKNICECLADEIMQAAEANPNCSSIKKKEDIEKNAKANR